MFGKIIMVSGGFDPLHVGHVRMINHAASYGRVLVILNSDEWLMRKKGYVFMPFYERQEVLLSLRSVAAVYGVDDSDDSVAKAIDKYRPDCFGNGGDRTEENASTTEVEMCKNLEIDMVWNLGGPKIASSSNLIKNIWKDK